VQRDADPHDPGAEDGDVRTHRMLIQP
jgi:hypothetical protein